jgi:hypothetical protein
MGSSLHVTLWASAGKAGAHTTECRARWCIQPSLCSCIMMASIQGYPVRASSLQEDAR